MYVLWQKLSLFYYQRKLALLQDKIYLLITVLFSNETYSFYCWW